MAISLVLASPMIHSLVYSPLFCALRMRTTSSMLLLYWMAIAGAEGNWSAIGIEWRLIDGGLGQHHPSIVLIPIGTTLNASGITLKQNAVA